MQPVEGPSRPQSMSDYSRHDDATGPQMPRAGYHRRITPPHHNLPPPPSMMPPGNYDNRGNQNSETRQMRK